MEIKKTKIVLITGSSSGIGKITTEKLLAKGFIVFAALRGGTARLKEIFPSHDRLYAVDLDLLNLGRLDEVSAALDKHAGSRLDILINCAGYGLLGPVELQSIPQIERQLRVNFLAPVQLIQFCLPRLRASRGKILNITSMVAYTSFPFYGTYAASKAALHSITETLNYELAEFGVQAASIEPGAYRTSFQKNVETGDRDGADVNLYSARIGRFQKFIEFVQKKMEKDPESLADLIVSLCEKDRIRPRYVVGLDAHINLFFRRLVPDRIYVPIQNWIYKKLFF